MNEDDTRTEPARRSAEWPRKLRWFGAEFLVVVTGVLVALAFNAWWGGREEAAREAAYLRQIHSELLRTEEELTAEIEYTTQLFDRAARLFGAFFAPVPPPYDSLQPLLFMDHADPEPVLGTLRAIVATGDLQLVRDDSVRAALVWLGDRARYYDERLRKWENVIVQTYPTLTPGSYAARTLDWDERGRPPIPEEGGGTWAEAMVHLPPQIRRPRFLEATPDLLTEPAVYGAAATYLLGQRNHRRNQERLLEDVRTTRRVVESGLE